MKQKRKIGEIFVEKGIITEKTLARALARSKRLNRKIGTVLETMEVITNEELTDALANQYGYKVIGKFAHYKFPRALLDLIPMEVAMQHLLFPLKLGNDKLALAMADPTDTKVISAVAANDGLTIIPFIATRKDILEAISRHYLGKKTVDPDAKSILVAAEDKHIYTMLRDLLQKAGYRVVVATDGLEAYKLVLSEGPKVIITDKEMPKLDGYALLDAIKNMPEISHIPVLLLASRTDSDEESRAFEKGFFDFLTKPVKEMTLLARVNRAFQFAGGDCP